MTRRMQFREQKEWAECLQKRGAGDVMVKLGRRLIHQEFGHQPWQILQREQCPVAFGLLVGFLFYLLPIENGHKKRGVMGHIRPAQHFFINQSINSQGKGRHSHSTRAYPVTWSTHELSFVTIRAHMLRRRA